MAYFSKSDVERLDFGLLQNSFVILYFRQQFFAEDIATLKGLGYSTIEFDSSYWKSEEDFFDSFAKTLSFPAYFGRNLDALNDCLREVVISDEGGLIIAFSKFNLFKTQFPDFAWNVLDIISLIARSNLLLGKRLICLVQSDDPQILFKEVGAQPVIWNHREWMDTNRGL